MPVSKPSMLHCDTNFKLILTENQGPSSSTDYDTDYMKINEPVSLYSKRLMINDLMTHLQHTHQTSQFAFQK